MIKVTRIFIGSITAVAVFVSLALKNPIHKVQPVNHPPLVKIISPKNGSKFAANARVAYEIRVSDKEDGESKYQEINPKEVFLEVKYADDTATALSGIGKETKDSVGLTIIKTSNCMNCHAFNSKLIGPSFYEITHRYQLASKTEDSLVNHILNGSKGRWGNVQMPSNNKLNATDAKKVLSWLFKNAGDPSVTYMAGIQGSFGLNDSLSKKNVILIATYTDHGTKEEPGQKMEGEDHIVLYIK